jgi:hypothetical protein
MTEDEQVELGEYAEGLMRQDYFNVLVKLFEQNCFQEMMTTEPKAVKEREGVYSQIQALKTFLGLMNALVGAKDHILEHRQELSQVDAPIPGID